MTLKALRYLLTCMISGHVPSRRGFAALFKLHGLRLERHWPFILKPDGKNLNLWFEDILEFQYSRSRHFTFMVVGAFDGLTNDPMSRFTRTHECDGIFIEPQPAAFKRLCANWTGFPNHIFLNLAVDRTSGFRDIYFVPPGIEELPDWTEQLASFRPDHLLSHEAKAPGMSRHIRKESIHTISFEDLLVRFDLKALDVLQIDAEGMDAQLLAWFPFDRVRPSVLYYETAHMSPDEHQAVRARLAALGYIVLEADSPLDDMAVLI